MLALQRSPTETHVNIARLLLEQTPLETDQDERLFDITNHFYQGLNSIDDPKERVDIATFSLWAGKRAKASNAYQIALDYLSKGLEVLGDNGWSK